MNIEFGFLSYASAINAKIVENHTKAIRITKTIIKIPSNVQQILLNIFFIIIIF